MREWYDFYGEIGDDLSLLSAEFSSKCELWGKPCSMRSMKKNILSSNTRFTVAVRGAGVKASSVLELIDKKGIKGLKEIDGNCSVVVIDHTDEVVVMYRGPVGRYPLYWTQKKHEISWSTDIKLLEGNRLNSLYFYRYFIGMGFADLWRETPFKGINRVPRGHAIIFQKFSDPSILFKDPFNPKTDLENMTETEIYEMYQEQIHKSLVKHRGKSALFECSGGLDSSSLLIANKQLKNMGDSSVTYTWNLFKDVDETEQARRIASQVGIPWESVQADDLLPMSHIHSFPETHLPDEPSPDLFFYPWRLPIFQLAKTLGHDSIISGHGADDLLQGNYCFLADLLKQLKLKTAWQQALSIANAFPESGLKAIWFIKSYGLFPLLRLPQKSPLISSWDPAIHNRFMIPSFLHNSRMGIDLMKEMEKELKKIRLNTEYATQLSRNMSTVSLISDFDVIARDYGMEMSFPYVDRPLIEFILGLPHRYTIQGTKRKVITRHVFQKYLPNNFVRVQGNFYRLTFLSLQKYWAEIYNLVANSPLCDEGIITREKAIDFLEKWRAGKEVDSTATLTSLISACFWISKSNRLF